MTRATWWRLVPAMLVLAASLVAAMPAPASAACSCTPGGGVAALARQVDAVFTGQVTGTSAGVVGTGDKTRQVRRYTVTVDRVFQGAVDQADVVVVSPQAAKDCGLGKIPTGKPWVFFADGSGSKFFGNTCDGTQRATSELLRRVAKVLGPGDAVEVPPPARPPLELREEAAAAPTPLGRLLAPGAALTLLGLLGLAAVRRTRTS